MHATTTCVFRRAIETAKMQNSNGLTVCISKLENFQKSIILYATKPHTINRQLAGAEHVAIYKYPTELNEDIHRIDEYIRTHPNAVIDKDFVPKLFEALDWRGNLIEINKSDLVDELNGNGSVIVLNKLLPKNLKIHSKCVELVVIGPRVASFHSLDRTSILSKSFKLTTDFANGKLTAGISNDNDRSADYKMKLINWIERIFLPKIQKWIDSGACVQSDDQSIQSLALVDLHEYNELYNELKVKYGENMVKIWPERTDPAKFVYEDIAIATYLLILWRDERKRLGIDRLQSFVDLGCGNGLLVYILSSEGHHGHGIDLRARGIWSTYPPTTILRTEAITPSDNSLYPDIDWIIGNHSDELSPWVPVIAARSSPTCRYFVLPCCAYEFDGRKYQRRSAQNSQYADFLNYVECISNVCGFHTKVDRLKIPSTKRICIIGNQRNIDSTQFERQNVKIQQFIDAESGTTTATNEQWNSDFRPRPSVEKVQNCTQIDKTVEREIVAIVFDELLKKKRFLTAPCAADWNVGGRIALADLIKVIPREKLKALKSECGGLQTMLKNNSQIFCVNGGAVEVRVPVKYCDKLIELKQRGGDKFDDKQLRFKQKPCWFLANHPNGCPFDAENCSYKH